MNGTNATKQELQSIWLIGLGTSAQGLSITTTAVPSEVTGGDGFANLGSIVALRINLGAVTVDGDLGLVIAGDPSTSRVGLRVLSVQSLGRHGSGSYSTGLTTIVDGMLGSLRVKSDIDEASIEVNGKLGAVMIGGSLIGGPSDESGRIHSSGAMGIVKIGGNVQGGAGACPALFVAKARWQV